MSKEEESLWLHELRDAWRGVLWKRVVKDRGHHYGGAEKVDRRRTMSLYNELQRQARGEAEPTVACDLEEWGRQQAEKEEGAKEAGAVEARINLGVLRRILAGGLLTSERVARHRKDGGSTLCSCGAGDATVEHVSWECSRYLGARKELMEQLPAETRLATCTRYAAIIPEASDLQEWQVVLLQKFLVHVWRDQIRRWHGAADVDANVEASASASSDFKLHENGHVLANREGKAGLWCRKCGRFVARVIHVRLKITSKPCPFKDLPESKWLAKEGAATSEARLDLAEKELQDKYNKGGHELRWNRKLGKIVGSEEEGKIECLRCGRKWSWKYRVNNLPRSTCTQTAEASSSASAQPAAPKAVAKPAAAKSAAAKHLAGGQARAKQAARPAAAPKPAAKQSATSSAGFQPVHVMRRRLHGKQEQQIGRRGDQLEAEQDTGRGFVIPRRGEG
jgi:hypothetical protein